MARGPQGYNNKYARLEAANRKVTQPTGEYQETMFFEMGDLRGRLAIWEHRVEFEVFADPEFSQHLDWNDPRAKVLNHLPSPVSILTVLSTLVDAGWKWIDYKVQR